MGRPERRDVDYFPFYIKDGRTLFILENKYQCKGTGFFTNVMRFLSRTPDHHFQIEKESDKLYFFATVKCDQASGLDMIEIMVETQKLDRDCWEQKKVIACQDYLLSIQDAYRKRLNECITLDEIKTFYGITTGRNKVTAGVTTPDSDVGGISSGDNPQSKEKESKEKESKFYSEESDELQLLECLINLIYQRNPKHKKPDLQKWAKEINSLIRIDNKDPQIIKSVIIWCQGDSFWQNNILSTKKLREHFDKLYLKMTGGNKGDKYDF